MVDTISRFNFKTYILLFGYRKSLGHLPYCQCTYYIPVPTQQYTSDTYSSLLSIWILLKNKTTCLNNVLLLKIDEQKVEYPLWMLLMAIA